jgi:hypothetical protein
LKRHEQSDDAFGRIEPSQVSEGVRVVLLGAVVAASAVIITFALRRGPNVPGAMDIQRMWHRARHDRAALGVDGDAQDLMRMDSDKG